jgi:hypothetical protein
MRPCFEQHPWHIPTSNCSKRGLARRPPKHKTKWTENDQVGYLCTKLITWTLHDKLNKYERDNQWWLKSTYSQSKLTWTFFSGGKYGWGRKEKTGSKLGLNFSKHY